MECPQCGGAMHAHPALDARKQTKAMVDAGSSVHYATNFAATVAEKEQAHGVVYTCGSCRYVDRVLVGDKKAGKGKAA